MYFRLFPHRLKSHISITNIENLLACSYDHHFVHLPSFKNLVKTLSKPHIVCQMGEPESFPRSLWRPCTFCTNVIETLIPTNKSFINCVWTIWFPANFLQRRQKKFQKETQIQMSPLLSPRAKINLGKAFQLHGH